MPQIPNHKVKFHEERIEVARRTMLTFAKAHMKSAAQAEDVVQEACFTIVEKDLPCTGKHKIIVRFEKDFRKKRTL